MDKEVLGTRRGAVTCRSDFPWTRAMAPGRELHIKQLSVSCLCTGEILVTEQSGGPRWKMHSVHLGEGRNCPGRSQDRMRGAEAF